MQQIGITEQGDAGIDFAWMPWVADGSPAVLITKNPASVAARLAQMIANGSPHNVIVHANITGNGGTALEPHVPLAVKALAGFARLVDLLGAERVVLRIDPILGTPEGIYTAIAVIRQARRIAETRVRVSWLDLYPHSKERMDAAGISYPWTAFHTPLWVREDHLALLELAAERPIEVCGEPGMDVTPCVGPLDAQILGVELGGGRGWQRRACRCVAEKFELLSTKAPCQHGCTYCYWKGDPPDVVHDRSRAEA
ncbi:MAG TPA: DUF1848 family protein [Roseiflexaceae bacterium]